MKHANTFALSLRRATQFGCFAAALAACAGTALAVPIVYNLGVMPGGTNSQGGIVSGDGNTVTGWGDTTVSGGGSLRPFRWVFPGPMQVVPLTVGSAGSGISFNGQAIVGYTSPGNTPFRWTLASGFTSLHLLPGAGSTFAISTSSNSSVSAGYSFMPATGYRAVRWNSTGVPQNLGTLPGAFEISPAQPSSYANGISPNGWTVVGSASWTPGVSHAFRWDLPFGPMISLGTLPGHNSAQAVAMSQDNSTIVGFSEKNTGSVLYPRAFRLKAPLPMQNLGVISGASGGVIIKALAVSGNGSTVVGHSYDGSVSYDGIGPRAFFWTHSTGMRNLKTYIASLGGNVTGWIFTAASGISSDGTAISGQGTFNGQARAFLIKGLPCLPPIASWFLETGPVGICADPAWPIGSGPNLPSAAATITIDSDGSDPLEHVWFVTIGEPAGTAPQPITGPDFTDAQTGLTFSVEGWTTPTITISNLRPNPQLPQIRLGVTVTNPCGTIATTLRELRVSATCAPAACSAADLVGGDGNPPSDGSVDGNDFQAFLNSFAADNALADIVGGDGNPPADGNVDGNDFQAFLNAFGVGC